ncbi:MAG: ISAs1 family transposase [Propionivibrio sp.]|jgi:hypothetical protein|uniref:ISAs1 family transposase n=1 Tax=Propionivibrio sp. TaxID=2212460 RepID=UPI001B67B2B4|nr:ISAs1 family transposase [Propionivibrio sp.]MBP7203756.1 ISAs1 family transposase [Propionivibrio sp.]
MTLLSIFSRLEDPRRGPAKRNGLREILVMAICAVLCGADDWVEVAEWCEDEADWLKGFLDLPQGTPSHDTFGDVFRVLDPDVFESCFREWIGGLVGVVKDIIALDGKTVCGSKDGAIPPLHLVSAYATALGLTLGQEGVAGKGNELKAIRAHWSVESMHWVLDVTFREDACRVRKEDAARNLSLLRKITLAMLRLDTAYPKSGLRQRRNRASRKPLYRAELLGLRPRSQTSTTKSIQ